MSGTISGQRVAERLYYDSPEVTFRARVTDISLVSTERGGANEGSQLWQVALDRTAFYPESGGQPWDTGTLIATARSGASLEIAVERVEEDEAGEVWHFLRKPLVEGTEVEGRVNPERRMDHMQQHSGQHLLSAVFFRQMGARTVSFHLGAETATVDLELPAEVGALGREQILAAEAEVNRLIFEDRVLRAQWFDREQAEAMLARGDLRKLPERTGPIRIVEMQGVEWNACGGTHVCSTGAIGGVAVRRIERVKRTWRVEFVCGQRLVRRARRDFELLSDVANRVTVGFDDLPVRVTGMQTEVKALAKKLQATLGELAEAKGAELIRSAPGQDVVQAIFSDKPGEFAKRVASSVVALGRTAVIGVHDAAGASVVVCLREGETRNAAELLREVAPAFGARGGGSGQMAQGVCEPSQLEGFLRELAQRLR